MLFCVPKLTVMRSLRHSAIPSLVIHAAYSALEDYNSWCHLDIFVPNRYLDRRYYFAQNRKSPYFSLQKTTKWKWPNCIMHKICQSDFFFQEMSNVHYNLSQVQCMTHSIALYLLHCYNNGPPKATPFLE